jgi:hypothetical protein
LRCTPTVLACTLQVSHLGMFGQFGEWRNWAIAVRDMGGVNAVWKKEKVALCEEVEYLA